MKISDTGMRKKGVFVGGIRECTTIFAASKLPVYIKKIKQELKFINLFAHR